MPGAKQLSGTAADHLAAKLLETLARERVVPRFVDSYVVENSRHALQVHPALYRDLLALLQREALLAACVCVLGIVSVERLPGARGKQQVVPRKGATTFRRRFLAALAEQQRWTAGDALEFQSDLQMYEDLLARSASSQRARKAFEAANHPFVDRCAFLLDSSFMAEARLAASRTLKLVEEIAAAAANQLLDSPGRGAP